MVLLFQKYNMYCRLPLLLGLATYVLTVSAGHKQDNDDDPRNYEDNTSGISDEELAMCNDMPYDSDIYSCLDGM